MINEILNVSPDLGSFEQPKLPGALADICLDSCADLCSVLIQQVEKALQLLFSPFQTAWDAQIERITKFRHGCVDVCLVKGNIGKRGTATWIVGQTGFVAIVGPDRTSYAGKDEVEHTEEGKVRKNSKETRVGGWSGG